MTDNALQGVMHTLFIPLEARIFVSKKFPEYFYDEKALELECHISDRQIRKKSSEYAFMASVARYYNLDEMTKAFMAKHEAPNIVFLGVGLETAYDRIKPSKGIFYQMDLPEVIRIRRRLLGEREREVFIEGDLFDLKWADKMDVQSPTLLIVSGVFQYFHEEDVLKLIQGLKNIFPKGELIFDATNETGIKYANRYVKKTGNQEAQMYFYINNAEEFANKTGTVLLEERTFFRKTRKLLSGKLKIYTRIAMKLVDDKKRAILVHLKLNE